MVEYLDDLLAGDHLLNIAVHIAQGRLLHRIVGGTALGAVPNIEEHGQIAQHHNEGQLPVEYEQHDQGARQLNKALDGHGKAVVQGIRDGVHIVGEVTHDIAVALGIEESQRQRLDVMEQVPADVIQHLLGGIDHSLGVAQGGQGTDAVDGGGDHNAPQKAGDVSVPHAVDHRANHVGAQQVCHAADGDQHRHRQEQELVPSHVGEQRPECESEMFGLFTRYCPRHRCCLPSSENDKFPDRWGRWPAAGCGCPLHGCGRHPAPQSCRCPSPR